LHPKHYNNIWLTVFTTYNATNAVVLENKVKKQKQKNITNPSSSLEGCSTEVSKHLCGKEKLQQEKMSNCPFYLTVW